MIIKYFKEKYAESPLAVILILGLFARLIAAIFSKGYGMHDDHFLIIEAGQSIASGYDYNNWLPWNSGGVPSGHSWFYVGFHFFLFKIFDFVGILDPQVKMLLVRFIHAVYSLSVIVLAFRITERLSSKENALKAAWMLSLLWFIPAMSVRNLVEWVCVPPILASTFNLIKFEQEGKRKDILWTGFWAGIAMGVRYQTLWFFVGVGVYMLMRKQIVNGIFCFLAFFAAFFLTQANDLFLWGRPFVEMQEYIEYNIANSEGYGVSSWYKYFLTLGGMLIPPISLFLFVGYFSKFKKFLPVFIPSLIFLLFHSYFPNKQERFILPFVPYLIIGGLIGWSEIKEKFKWKKFEAGSWKFFWIINIIPLIVLSTNYSKRSRVEAMSFLYEKADYNNYVMESSHTENAQAPPQFYSGKWQKAYYVFKGYPVEKFQEDISKKPASDFPNYIMFFEDEDLKNRVAKFELVTGKKLKFIQVSEASYLDDLLHWLNPKNKNQPIFIYRIG